MTTAYLAVPAEQPCDGCGERRTVMVGAQKVRLHAGPACPDFRAQQSKDNAAQPPPGPSVALREALEKIEPKVRAALHAMQDPLADMIKRCMADRPHNHDHLSNLRAAMRDLTEAHGGVLAALATAPAEGVDGQDALRGALEWAIADWERRQKISARGNLVEQEPEAIRRFRAALAAPQPLPSAPQVRFCSVVMQEEGWPTTVCKRPLPCASHPAPQATPARTTADRVEAILDGFDEGDAQPAGHNPEGVEARVAQLESALAWVFGEKPDAQGRWFDHKDFIPPLSRGGRVPMFWWRKPLREMVSTVNTVGGPPAPAAPHEGEM